ncbi:MAG: hypothetical protein IJI43_03805 [Bacilli bacterium]|nr:hypothetical protein [Bacilli bacterium]
MKNKKVLLIVLGIILILGFMFLVLWLNDPNRSKRLDNTLLFDNEYYKNLDIKNISKVEIYKATEGGVETEEITYKEEIKNIYNDWKNVRLIKETEMACEDNTVIYTFVMNNGKTYNVEKECDWLIVNQKRYLYE